MIERQQPYIRQLHVCINNRNGESKSCAFGPNMMIWPEGLWYMKVAKEDVPQIIEKYLTLEAADQAK